MFDKIATAPLDGRELILFSRTEEGGGWIVWQGRWRQGLLRRSRWVETGRRYGCDGKPDQRRLLQPLYWIPVPGS